MDSRNLELGAALALLSDKERDVLDQLLQHKSLKLVARDLGLSVRTIEERLKTARAKLGAADRHEATRFYAAELRACGKTTCGFSRMGAEPIASHLSLRDEATPTLLALRDSGIVTVPQPLTENGERASIPEVFDQRFGRLWRFLAIPAFAFALIVLALALVAMARALDEIL